MGCNCALCEHCLVLVYDLDLTPLHLLDFLCSFSCLLKSFLCFDARHLLELCDSFPADLVLLIYSIQPGHGQDLIWKSTVEQLASILDSQP